ncbi:MAG: RsmB/NOP family class I SAM-dependent RNA methyltransferase, partial [Spirochaetia bacterium]|nr:RsmB/NOP family class I SAM-dependent RNA methyltransferase [Spirochaetia bacterium]
ALLIVKGDVVKTAAFESGLVYVQDLAPQAASMLVESGRDDAIVDIGSAPGGKAASFAMDMKDKGSIVAIEPNEARLKVMERNFVRLGITNTQFIKHDATVDIEAFHGKADKVIVDAPCSALGVIRRHPEKKWCLTEAELKEFPKLQMKILETVKEWVKKGGEIYYMTCTLNPDENEKLIEKFLEKNGEFKVSAILPDDTKWKEFRYGNYLRILPGNKMNCDGFFTARLKRKTQN